MRKIRFITAVAAMLMCMPCVAKDTPGPASRKEATASAKGKNVSSSSTESKSDNSTITAEIRKADSKSSGKLSSNTVLVVTITGEMKERTDAFLLFGQQTKSLKDYLDLLRKAREDKEIKTVVFRFSGAQIGLGMGQEIRAAIGELRAKGKKTIAVLEDDEQASYLVATACDQVVLPPSAELMLYGVKADGYFIKNLLDKVGVAVDVVHIGKYKSFGEMFTHDQFTSPARENMQEIVDDAYGQMVSIISSARQISAEEAGAAIDRGPVSPEEAKKSKLVDRVAYADEILQELEKKGATVTHSSDYKKDTREKLEDFSIFNLFSIMKQKESTTEDSGSKLPQVAVVYAVGPISLGSRDGMGFGSEEEIASDDFIETLDEIEQDGKIKAVILRVNSPGGSAFASDLIWRKVEQLKKTKPVVASMSDVAASGGYYIAMGANKIIAQDGTITGSIGVVGGKPNLSGVYKKLGISKETISKGEFTSLFSETSSFTDKERNLIERMMRETYDEFISKAAVGRNMQKEKLDELAQGKVWTGARAKTVGLVDDIGGISRAILEVKTLIGLKKDDKVSLVTYPKEQGLFDMLQKAIGGNVTAQVQAADPMTMLPRGLRNVLNSARSIARMWEREKVLAIMPFITVIE